jgi:hypothetical protein
MPTGGWYIWAPNGTLLNAGVICDVACEGSAGGADPVGSILRRLSYLDGSLQSNDLYVCRFRLSFATSPKLSWSFGNPKALAVALEPPLFIKSYINKHNKGGPTCWVKVC